MFSLEPLAVYLHIPFCRSRCTYCAFNTYTGQTDRIAPYMNALRREIDLVAGKAPVYTVYFGGGTPSLVPVEEIAATLARCTSAFQLTPNVEITLEANPGTVNLPYLTELRRIGVNRLSIGMQSAHASELKLFARGHAVDDVRDTVDMARTAGFDNLSLDLIYGVPRQTLSMWKSSLNTALSYFPDHLSLYSLGIEPATPMQQWVEQGTIPLPDSDLAADMYEWTQDRLAAAGYEHYEISNWARPGFVCLHNIHYWHNRPYLGLGAGAHGYIAGLRYSNVLHPSTYIERILGQTYALQIPLSAAADTVSPVDISQAMAETMIMGLRLTEEGISTDAFYLRFGSDLAAIYGPEIDRLSAHELIAVTGSHVRLTPRGRLLGNIVFSEFV